MDDGWKARWRARARAGAGTIDIDIGIGREVSPNLEEWVELVSCQSGGVVISIGQMEGRL